MRCIILRYINFLFYSILFYYTLYYYQDVRVAIERLRVPLWLSVTALSIEQAVHQGIYYLLANLPTLLPAAPTCGNVANSVAGGQRDRVL